MISAIIGLGRDSYYERFSPSKTRFAIRILSRLRKARINLSLIDTSRGFFLRDIGKNPRTPIPFEFMKDSKYRIYFWTKDEDFRKTLKMFLEQHKSYYTPCLGLAGLIAEFSYVGEFDLKKSDGGPIHSVARRDRGKLIVEEKKRYGLEKIPVWMNEERVVQEYAEVVYEIDGKTMSFLDAQSYEVGSENVTFL
jgi:CRISPR-associated protein Cas5h